MSGLGEGEVEGGWGVGGRERQGRAKGGWMGCLKLGRVRNSGADLLRVHVVAGERRLHLNVVDGYQLFEGH